MKKSCTGGVGLPAFTITELIAAMVVLAIVVVITTPIIRKKMEKVSYAQYWMGYNAAQSIAKNLPQVDDSSKTCDVEFAGHCWTIVGVPTPITYEECETIKVELGIKNCRSGDDDYWGGAVKKCGGVDNMPTMQQLADLASIIYGQEGMEAHEDYSPLTIKDHELYDAFVAKSPFFDYFFVWSGEEYSNGNAYYHDFRTGGSYYGSNRNYIGSAMLAVCLSDGSDDNKTGQAGLCETIKDRFNTSDYDCTLENVTDSSDFENPHITFSNGLRLFVGSDYEELFPDAENENDRTGYKVYIDINGSKGKGILWEDVFPYYILKSGKVLAGYPNDAEIGGNNSEYLSVNVLYDDYSGANRAVKFLLLSTDYKTAVCKTGIMKSKIYCGDIETDDRCKVYESDCRIRVKTPIKIF